MREAQQEVLPLSGDSDDTALYQSAFSNPLVG
jgi:hypothetical protein